MELSLEALLAVTAARRLGIEVNSVKAGGVVTLSLLKRLLQMPVQCLSEIQLSLCGNSTAYILGF